jgi:uncharacterized protein (TIGR02466 family)
MIEIKKDNWWPTPIWCFDADPTQIDFDKIKEEAYEIKAHDQGRAVSNYGGWQSNDLDLTKDNETNKLLKFIEQGVACCLDDVGAGPKVNKMITDCWVNINKKGDGNHPHIHPSSTLSGVVYIQGNDKSGNIRFHSNSPENYYYLELTNNHFDTQTNPYNFSYVFYPCEKYKVIVFPSILLHSVEPNNSDEDRISLAFNVGK